MFILRQAGPTLIMSCRAIRALVVCTALVSMPLQAAQRWTGLTTPHFEMYTNNSMGSGTKALETFERVRSFSLDNSPSKHAPDTPVRIIAFRSEKDFEPYRPNDGAFAYYQRSRKRDYIVMQDLSPEHYRTAVHEYTHLIVEHSGLKLPIWLNEGLADLYSSMEPKGNQTMVGRPIEGHLNVLGNEKWLDLALLTSVRQDSPYYNERTKMQIFYAESWALTHMLALGKDYQAGFGRFLASASAGADADASFRAIYGKTLAQVTSDLNGYFHHRTIQVSLFDSKLEKLNLQPEARDLSALQTELALADLLSGQTRKAAQAKERLDRIAAEYPQSAEVEESLGYFAWQSGDAQAATAHFAKATEKGINDPEMLYHYATLIASDSDRLEETISLLNKALALKPEYREARYALGLQELNHHRYGLALSILLGLKTVEPDHAFDMYSALAYCYLQLKSPMQARDLELRAKRYAKTLDEQQRVESFLEFLDETQAAASLEVQQSATTDRSRREERRR